MGEVISLAKIHTVFPLTLCNDCLDSLLFCRTHLVIQCALCIKIDLFIDVTFYSRKKMILSAGNNL